MVENNKVIKRPHTCPVVYLQNFSKISEKYYQKLKNFNVNSYREPNRNEFIICAHDKLKNSDIFKTSLQKTGVRKLFYTDRIEHYLKTLESNVGKQFRKIREMIIAAFINPYHVFRFIMSQLIRTPKFQEKIRRDQIFLRDMDNNEFQESIMRSMLVQKPTKVTENSLKKIHEDFIMNNMLETIYKWSTVTLVTNNTDTPFITSDSPVVYNNAEFFPSYLNNEYGIHFSIICVPETVIFFFPIDSRFAVIINKINPEKTDATIKYEDISDRKSIINFNMLEYQYAERFIYLREPKEDLIKKLREKCVRELNKDYQSMEFSYKVLKEEN